MQRKNVRTGLARRQRHQRFAIRHWTDRLVDVPAFIIGNGPSLNDSPLKLLEDYFTIGVNRAFYRIDPTVLVWQDISLWNTEYKRLHNTQAIKVSRDVSDPRKVYYNFHLKGGDYRFDPKNAHIAYGRGSTGPIAVQLAVAFGCRPIILMGMECVLGSDGKTDFYGENKYWTEATLTNCQQGLEFIKEQCPVEVYNCGYSDLWPRQKLEDILEALDKRHKRNRQSYVRQLLNLSSSR